MEAKQAIEAPIGFSKTNAICLLDILPITLKKYANRI